MSEPYLSDRFEFAAPGDQQEDVWFLRFSDPDCREMMWQGADAEDQAWKAWNQYSPSYNCFVFRLARFEHRRRPNVLDLPNCPECHKSREEFAQRSTCGTGGCPWGGDF